jgi:hypothetical protein
MRWYGHGLGMNEERIPKKRCFEHENENTQEREKVAAYRWQHNI